MKKSLNLYFQIHLPSYLRQYRFFDIGHSHQYFDNFRTKSNLMKTAYECYLPLNAILLDLIKMHKGAFKLSLSMTGEVIEQMEDYAPEVLDSFKTLAKTGFVEFVNETYSHSLIFLADEQEFKDQVEKNAAAIKKHFKQVPTTLRLTGMIYSDKIGELAQRMGYKTMLTENAKHIMGWKSPNFIYKGNNAGKDKLNLLLRNSLISDRISFHFNDPTQSFYPINCEKMVTWLNETKEKDELVNIFMDYGAFGHRYPASTGIFEFIKHLPAHVLADGKFEFQTPSEIVKKHKPTETLDVPYPISWYEAERDLSIWLGNDMQKDAFNAMTILATRIRFIDDATITRDWKRLQDGDHFYYMCTRWQADEMGRKHRTPYSSPFNAYTNYMNVLSDLVQRVNTKVEKRMIKMLEDESFNKRVFELINYSYSSYTNSDIDQIIELITAKEKKTLDAKKKKTTSKAVASKKK